MAPLKCCVLGCESTSATHRLFCMPMNDNLRNLWMSFLVPVNPHLLGLSKGQLMTKRVCQKHFDETQFSQGSRIRYSYPCLFTEKEFIHGVPLSSEEYNVLNEHNYCTNQEGDDTAVHQVPATLMGMPGDVHLHEHLYALPSTSQEAAAPKPNEADVSLQEVQHSVSPVIIQSTTVPARLEIEADVSLQEHQHPVSPSTVQSTTVTTVHSVEADVSLQEHHPVSPSTVQSTTLTAKYSIEGLSCSRKPLMDITHQYNVTGTTQFSEQHISADKRVNSPQETMETTAAVVLFFDELFDSVNGSPGQGKGKLRCAVKETSSHKDFWLNAIRTLQSTQLV
ncbi:uncharacterized protein LOC134793046 [Cydia splendana]|uniref:uncharacterized protein LOC134793046 n=1 Tax=Cydia splendana TaxID=1100963 RepID=UPI00300D63B6